MSKAKFDQDLKNALEVLTKFVANAGGADMQLITHVVRNVNGCDGYELKIYRPIEVRPAQTFFPREKSDVATRLPRPTR
jgi:hypothetical protein